MDQTIKLTTNQERFCDLYLTLGNASQAYKEAFNRIRIKDTIIANRAGKLTQPPQIQTRITELRQQLDAKASFTKEKLLLELETIIKAKVTNYHGSQGSDINYKDFRNLKEEYHLN